MHFYCSIFIIIVFVNAVTSNKPSTGADVTTIINQRNQFQQNKGMRNNVNFTTNAVKKTRRFRRHDEYGERVVLASYPRSGTSMLRKLLEDITGIHTGTDHHESDLRNYGFQEEIVSATKNTWIVKSHFPEVYGMHFSAERGILLVRHPINALESYFNLQITEDHTRSLNESQYDLYANEWNKFILTEAQVWVDFHEYWMKQKIPLLIVRYEDLLLHRERELKRIFEYLYQPSKKILDRKSSNGNTFSAIPWVSSSEMIDATERLTNVLNQNAKSNQIYKPRKASINPDYTHYSQTQRNAVLKLSSKYLNAYGYITDKGNTNTVAFQMSTVRYAYLNRPGKGLVVPSVLKLNDGPVRVGQTSFARNMARFGLVFGGEETDQPTIQKPTQHFQQIQTTVKYVGHDRTPVVVLDNLLSHDHYLSLRDSLRTRTDFYEGHGNKVNFPGKIAALDRLTVDPLIDAVLSSELLSRHFPPAMFDRKFISGFASILCNPWGKYERLFFFLRVVQLYRNYFIDFVLN